MSRESFTSLDEPQEVRLANALLTVAKQPLPGATKTRLSPPLSAAQSAALYESFLLDTLELIRRVPGVDKGLVYLPADAFSYFQRLAPDFDLLPQEGDRLGERLYNVLQRYLASGYRRVVVMDSDSPTLPGEYLVAAFTALTAFDVVLGPCEDGGYYLIGLSRPVERLLLEVEMSTPRVLEDTLALAEAEGLRVRLLPTWYDIDDAAGLTRLQGDLGSVSPGVALATRHTLQTFNGLFT